MFNHCEKFLQSFWDPLEENNLLNNGFTLKSVLNQSKNDWPVILESIDKYLKTTDQKDLENIFRVNSALSDYWNKMRPNWEKFPNILPVFIAKVQKLLESYQKSYLEDLEINRLVHQLIAKYQQVLADNTALKEDKVILEEDYNKLAKQEALKSEELKNIKEVWDLDKAQNQAISDLCKELSRSHGLQKEQIADLKKEIADIKGDLSEKIAYIERLLKMLAAQDAELRELQDLDQNLSSVVEKDDQDLQEKENQNQQLHLDLTNLKKVIDELKSSHEQELAELNLLLEQIRKDYHTVLEENSDLKEKLANLDKLVQKLQSENQALRDQNLKFEQTIADLQKEKQDLKNAAQSLAAEKLANLGDFQARESELLAKIQELEQQMREVGEKNDSIKYNIIIDCNREFTQKLLLTLEKELSKTKLELEQLRIEKAAAELKIQNLTELNQDQESQIANQKKENQDLNNNNESLTNNIQQLEHKIENLNAEKNELEKQSQTEKESYQKKREELNQQIEKLQEEKEKIKADFIEQLNAANLAGKEACQQLENQYQELIKQKDALIAELTDSLELAQKNIGELEAKIQALNNAINELKKELAGLQNAYSLLAQRNQELQDSLNKADLQQEKMADELKEKEQKIADLANKRELSSVKLDNPEMMKTNMRLIDDKINLNREIVDLLKMEKSNPTATLAMNKNIVHAYDQMKGDLGENLLSSDELCNFDQYIAQDIQQNSSQYDKLVNLAGGDFWKLSRLILDWWGETNGENHYARQSQILWAQGHAAALISGKNSMLLSKLHIYRKTPILEQEAIYRAQAMDPLDPHSLGIYEDAATLETWAQNGIANFAGHYDYLKSLATDQNDLTYRILDFWNHKDGKNYFFSAQQIFWAQLFSKLLF
ncbi:MAG TPA: hypothetical protein PLQ36_00080 [Candidatus Gracilibacteria bacterium]|nr:hypothetical protein [Candidatus Gracilibacteria bacterium]